MNEVTKTQIDNRRSLEEQISRPAPADALPLRVWTLRIHEEVAREIETLARLKRMSVNSYVVWLFDQALRQDGRPSVTELAPEFVEYLRRTGGKKKPTTVGRSSEFGFSDE